MSIALQLLPEFHLGVATSSGYSAHPFHAAIRKSNYVLFSFVLDRAREQGCLRELCLSRDETGSTPLHVAITYRRGTMIRLLVSLEPAACLATDSQGELPLHVAVTTRCMRYIKLLMGTPTSAEAVNTSNTVVGGTPYELALIACERELTLYLRRYTTVATYDLTHPRPYISKRSVDKK